MNCKADSNEMKWVVEQRKTDFSTVFFTDECHALPTHNGLGKGRKGWLLTDRKHTHRLNLQQAGGDVMFWSGITGGDVVSLWQVLGGDKMTIQVYIEYFSEGTSFKHFDKDDDFYAQQYFITCKKENQ